MKVRRFKMLWSPQLPSPAKLTLQLCLQADDFGLYPAMGITRWVGSVPPSLFWAPLGPACVPAASLLLKSNGVAGEYFPL